MRLTKFSSSLALSPMNEVSRYSPLKNFTITILLTLFAILMAVSPVLANTSSWSFQTTLDGRYLDGSANGVTHSMTAGTLTNSGSIWVTSVYPTALPSASPWTIEVWKQVTGPDQKICSVTVTTGTAVGSTANFTKGCGSIGAGTYYIVVWRVNVDGRTYAGSGNLTT